MRYPRTGEVAARVHDTLVVQFLFFFFLANVDDGIIIIIRISQGRFVRIDGCIHTVWDVCFHGLLFQQGKLTGQEKITFSHQKLASVKKGAGLSARSSLIILAL